MGAKEVAAGAAWLDEVKPGWEREIDLGTLDLTQCHHCVCGQSLRDVAEDAGVFSGYDYARLLATGSSFSNASWIWAVEHGFSARDDDEWVYNEALWVELIKERFSTGNLSDVG